MNSGSLQAFLLLVLGEMMRDDVLRYSCSSMPSNQLMVLILLVIHFNNYKLYFQIISSSNIDLLFGTFHYHILQKGTHRGKLSGKLQVRWKLKSSQTKRKMDQS